MRKIISKMNILIVAFGLLIPAVLVAQKEEKVKEVKEKKEVRQIIITSKGDKDEKVVIEIKGDNVTVNGKSIDDYKVGDLKVKMNKLKDLESLSFERMPGAGVWNFDIKGDKDGKGGNLFKMYSTDSNLAMLGVTTQKTDNGVLVQSVTKESAAEKAGLKENDIITKIDDTKISEPDDLSAAIKEHKPGDKVKVTYLRDKKEQKVTTELTKWKGVNAWSMGEGNNFNMNFDNLHLDKMPNLEALKGLRAPNNQYRIFSGGAPKLGISVQDTDDGKGVKVIEVDEESNAAKAGIKEDDIITEFDGKTTNSTDDIVKAMKESKEKNAVMIKLSRNGKSMNIETKIPRKIKTADL
ncbi:MAG: PDZ domain-containing protein [Chitinophagaceae bacterium]